MRIQRTGADLVADAKKFTEAHPYDQAGSLALANRLEEEARAMDEYPTTAMQTVNRLLKKRFENADNQ